MKKAKFGVIGDVHLGFKAYDSLTRSSECIDTFELAIELLYSKDIRIVLIPGDLIDDTTWANWIEKRVLAIFRKYSDVAFVIDGGNHDSTKTYSSVSALDVLAEQPNLTIVNSFCVELVELRGLTIACVPHMKSQQAFQSALELLYTTHDTFDVLLIHAMVESNLDLSPNDLNISLIVLDKLAEVYKTIWIGHQHIPTEIIPGVIIPGSIIEFSFGELGPRYVYTVDNGVITLIDLPQPRKLVKLEEEWCSIPDILSIIDSIDPKDITKLVLKHVPNEMYSQVMAIIDSFSLKFSGDFIASVIKTGHTEVEISTINAHFDLLTEFDNFMQDNKISDIEMRNILEDAITLIAGEEEDLVI